MKAFEDEFGRRSHQRGSLLNAQSADRFLEAGNLFDPFQIVLRGHLVGDLHAPAGVEKLDDLLQGVEAEILVEDLDDGAVEQFFHQVVFLFVLAHVFHLDLAVGRRQHGMQIAHSRHDVVFPAAQRALFRVADDAFKVVDRHPHAHARGLIDLVGFTRLESQMAEDLLQEARHLDLAAAPVERRGLLLHDDDLVLDALGIMSADLHVEAVLKRGDDAAPAGVILGVGAGDDDDVQGQADLVALDLNVFLLHQVEQTHLNLFGQVGELVDGENTAIGARYQTIVDGFLVSQITPLGDLDRIYLAHQIGNGNIRRCQLFSVAMLPVDPLDRQRIAQFGGLLPAGAADRVMGIVVDLAALDDRNPLVQQADQPADHARFALAALPQEYHMVSGEDRVFDFGYDCIVVADDPRQDAFATF